jgi:predicted phosphoadenosine phosphosulfate sulfurtransferase
LHYIETWENRGYCDGIPDEVPARLMQLRKAPSYKAVAIAILKNDLTDLGYSPPVSAWYSELKRIEIEARPGLKQRRLFR